MEEDNTQLTQLAEDQLNKINDIDVTRRRFFAGIGNSMLLAFLGGFSLIIYKYLRPNVLFELPSLFKIGYPEKYLPNSITFLAERKIFIINNDNKVKALSAVCTHLGCTINLISNNRYRCPCHGSLFDAEGDVIEGPAPRALEHFEISIAKDGQLYIDITKKVDKGYSIKV